MTLLSLSALETWLWDKVDVLTSSIYLPMRNILFGLVLLSFSQCGTSISPEDLQARINKNREKPFFLSFWQGMTEDEFEAVLKYETQRGNLRYNRFFLKVPTKDSYEEVLFKINYHDGMIELLYEDERWIPHRGFYPTDVGYAISKEGASYGFKYNRIKDYLLNHLDEKYSKYGWNDLYEIQSYTSTGGGIFYQDLQKAVFLSSNINFFFIADWLRYINEEKQSVPSGADAHYILNSKKDKLRLAYCKISILYLSLQDFYQSIADEACQDSIEDANQRDWEIRKREKKIRDSLAIIENSKNL